MPLALFILLSQRQTFARHQMPAACRASDAGRKAKKRDEEGEEEKCKASAATREPRAELKRKG